MQPTLLRERINYIAEQLQLESVLEGLNSYFENNRNFSPDQKKERMRSILDFFSTLATLRRDEDNNKILSSLGFDESFSSTNISNLNFLISTTNDVFQTRQQDDFRELTRIYRNCYSLKTAQDLLNNSIHADLKNTDLEKFEDKLPLIILERDKRGVTVKQLSEILKELEYLITNICRLDPKISSTEHFISVIESGSDILMVIIGVTAAVKLIRKIFDDIGAIENSINQIRIGKAALTAAQLENAYSSLKLVERLETMDEFKDGVSKLNEEEKSRIYKSVINLAMKGVGTYGNDAKLLHGMRGLLSSVSVEEKDTKVPLENEGAENG